MQSTFVLAAGSMMALAFLTFVFKNVSRALGNMFKQLVVPEN